MAILFHLVVNPFWNWLTPNRLFFWLLFYTFPLALLALGWQWNRLCACLRHHGLSRPAKWGALIGGGLSLPAAIYRGLLGGMAAGLGSYGPLGPIWGAVVGFGYFLALGFAVGGTIGSVACIASRLVRWKA